MDCKILKLWYSVNGNYFQRQVKYTTETEGL